MTRWFTLFICIGCIGTYSRCDAEPIGTSGYDDGVFRPRHTDYVPPVEYPKSALRVFSDKIANITINANGGKDIEVRRRAYGRYRNRLVSRFIGEWNSGGREVVMCLTFGDSGSLTAFQIEKSGGSEADSKAIKLARAMRMGPIPPELGSIKEIPVILNTNQLSLSRFEDDLPRTTRIRHKRYMNNSGHESHSKQTVDTNDPDTIRPRVDCDELNGNSNH